MGSASYLSALLTINSIIDIGSDAWLRMSQVETWRAREAGVNAGESPAGAIRRFSTEDRANCVAARRGGEQAKRGKGQSFRITIGCCGLRHLMSRQMSIVIFFTFAAQRLGRFKHRKRERRSLLRWEIGGVSFGQRIQALRGGD